MIRICSLLPSATEIVYALGLEENLVAVSHECDFPPAVRMKPHVTSSAIDSTLSGEEIDAVVRRQLSDTGTLYHLDATLLESVRPNLVLTQELCTVCAVSFESVQRTVSTFQVPPSVVNLEPTSLAGVYQTIIDIGVIAGVRDRADAFIASLQERMYRLLRLTSALERRRVVFLEWIDPPFCAGHWIPELIDAAGGKDELSLPGRPSVQLAWEQIIEYNPDVIIISCCGFSVDRTKMELARIADSPFKHLGASRSGNIVVVDGSAYFSRPGPRLIESAEILATILHPEMFPVDYPEHVVVRLDQEISLLS